jgi:dTDP-4-dehydrorhamnose 3,5-epimerase
MIRVTKTALDGVVVIEPEVFRDERGSFSEAFSERDFAGAVAPVESGGVPVEGGAQVRFVQDNESHSRRGVVRGLHFQREPHAQAKLVRVTTGRILDVVVDMRRASPTFGRHIAVELSAENGRQLFIPRGFAHGFSVPGPDGATVIYKVDAHYAPGSDAGVRWNDPRLAIDWGIDPAEAIVSDKDAALPLFTDAHKFEI